MDREYLAADLMVLYLGDLAQVDFATAAADEYFAAASLTAAVPEPE